MNIQSAKEEIRKTVLVYTAKDEAGCYRIPIQRQRPIFLMGPPGIGKTAIMAQIADEVGIGLVAYTMTHHTRQSAIGLPIIEKKTFAGREFSVTDYTMSEILASVYSQIEATGKTEGILFLDEINCVSETLMPSMLQFLQYKTFGTHRLPEGWIVAAAGNPVRYNSSVRELDTATMDRLKWIDVEADLNVWMHYAKNHGIHPAVAAYLKWQPESFYAVETTAGSRNFVTARSWEDLSDILKALEAIGEPVSEDLPGEYLQHERIAREFGIFYELYEKCSHTPAENMEGLPFDEKLCILEIMLRELYSLAERYGRADDLTKKLVFFREGIFRRLGENKDLSFADICREQFENRQQALNVRKQYGILSGADEVSERRLLSMIEDLLHEIRIRPEKAGEITEGGVLPSEAVLSDEAVQAGAACIACAEENIALFDRLFKGKQESYLLAAGMKEHTVLYGLLKEKAPMPAAWIDETTDLKARAARL